MHDVTLTPQMAAMVPAITVTLQAVKTTPLAKFLKPWMPFLSIASGVALAFLGMPDEVTLAGGVKEAVTGLDKLLAGLIMGTSAVGIHSGLTNTADKIKIGKKKKTD